MLLRLFTVNEANRLLVQVRPLLVDLVETRGAMDAVIRDMHRMQQLYHASRGRPAAGLRASLEGGLERLSELEALLQERAGELAGHGVAVRDPARGLVDFPTILGRQPAYLCYLLGEDRVSHWHLVGEGFPERRPVEGPENPPPEV